MDESSIMVFPFILRFFEIHFQLQRQPLLDFLPRTKVSWVNTVWLLFITEYQLKVLKQIFHVSELSVCVAFIKGKLEWQERIPGLQHKQIRIWKVIFDLYVGKTESLGIISDKR